MLLTRKDFIGPLRSIKLGDHVISFVNKTHCLGFTIDNKLSWGYHIKDLTTSMTKKVKLLHRFKSLPSQILEPIYFKGILPSVTYGISVWGNCSEAKLDGLEKIHLRAAKLIFKQQIPPSWKSLSYFYKKRLLCLTLWHIKLTMGFALNKLQQSLRKVQICAIWETTLNFLWTDRTLMLENCRSNIDLRWLGILYHNQLNQSFYSYWQTFFQPISNNLY